MSKGARLWMARHLPKIFLRQWQTMISTKNVGRAMGPPNNDEKGGHGGVVGVDTVFFSN